MSMVQPATPVASQSAIHSTIPKDDNRHQIFCQRYKDSDGEFHFLYISREDALNHFQEIKNQNGGTNILEKVYPVWANSHLFDQICQHKGRLEGCTKNAPKCGENC